MANSNKGVKLVGYWASLYVHRVRWALKLKGIEYEYIEEDIYNKTPLLSKLNPVYAKVPVLVHNGKPLAESSVILEYIDETWKQNYPSLLPQDPCERAQARFWARVADQKVLESSWDAICLEGEKQDRALELVMENLEKFEEKLKGKSFFGGDKIGYLDLMIGFVSYVFPVWQEVYSVKLIDPVKFPAIAAWMDNFINHPMIKAEYLPSRDELRAYYQG